MQLFAGEGFDFALPTQALQEKGFTVKRWNAWMPPKQLAEELKTCCQLWLISSWKGALNTSMSPKVGQMTQGHIDVLVDFYHKGCGLYIWGDNDPLNAEATALMKTLFNAKMEGNEWACNIVTEKALSSPGPGFVPHLITTGIENLYEGITIAIIYEDNTNQPSRALTPLVYSSSGNIVTAYWDKGGRRCIVDGGFTRLYPGGFTASAGTARLVKNAAVWLANYERFGRNGVED